MADDSEWIEWAGGECPVAPGTPHQIKTADGWVSGVEDEREMVEDWCNGWWMHGKSSDGRDADQWAHCRPKDYIIAYRVVQS